MASLELNPVATPAGVTGKHLLPDTSSSGESSAIYLTEIDHNQINEELSPDPIELWHQSLLLLCAADFFQPCKIHSNLKKSECNFFYTSRSMTNIICRYCINTLSVSRDEILFQIRRYMHKNVVLLEDLGKAFDCRGIQSYYINQKKAILLSPKGRVPGSIPAFDTTCLSCRVPLRPDCTYCSLYCALTAPQEGLHDGANPVKTSQEATAGFKKRKKHSKLSAGRPVARRYARKSGNPERSYQL
jgi:hypothetical protein